MIFTEEDLNSLNAIAGLLASFGCDSQAGWVLYIHHKIFVYKFLMDNYENDTLPQMDNITSYILVLSFFLPKFDPLQKWLDAIQNVEPFIFYLISSSGGTSIWSETYLPFFLR